MTAAVLWYYHVCRRWRIILIDDKSLCGRVAFVFRRLELIELFLTRAGNSPLPLDFDDILQRTDRAEEHRNVLLGALLDNTERLCNAVTIKNLLGLPAARWFTRTRHRTFVNLESLEITINTANVVPDILAKRLRVLTLHSAKPSVIPAEDLIALLQTTPRLLSLSMRWMQCSGLTKEAANKSAALPHLQYLSLHNVEFGGYQSVRGLITELPDSLITSVAFMTPCSLFPLWQSLDIRTCPAVCAFIGALFTSDRRYTQVTIYKPTLRGQDLPGLDSGTVLSGAGYVRKLYFIGEEELVQDTDAYAEQVNTVILGGSLVEDMELMRPVVLAWLVRIPHPTVIDVDTRLRSVIEAGATFIKQSIRVIRIRCHYYRTVLREDDQFAINSVDSWIRAHLLSGDVEIQLHGYRYRRGDLELDTLRSNCGSLIDCRMPYPTY